MLFGKGQILETDLNANVLACTHAGLMMHSRSESGVQRRLCAADRPLKRDEASG